MTEPAAPLSEAEVRVLACLIEKAVTTPEYYPLTLNALTNACNQRSNRDPVVTYDEATVLRALDILRERGLARLVSGAGSRVPKYQHAFNDHHDLEKGEVAVLVELMLRGPQTPGELRSRGERMHPFSDLAEVEASLHGLLDRPEPFVTLIPRQTGQKEQRYAHRLSGDPVLPTDTAVTAPRTQDDGSGLARLEEEVAALRREVEALQQAFDRFRSQF